MFINKLSGKKMDIAYFNGTYMPRDEIRISPDDRGFLFAEGIYEVVGGIRDSFLTWTAIWQG